MHQILYQDGTAHITCLLQNTAGILEMATKRQRQHPSCISFSSSGNYYVTLNVYAHGAEPETDSITHKVTAISIPLGGYSIPIKVQTHTKAEPIISYTTIMALLAATLTKVRTKIKRRH